MNNFALELDQLTFQYPPYPGHPSRPLFRDLSLKIRPGEFVVILGAPDAGKTTLSRVIMDLLPRYSGGVRTGRILLKGKEVGAWEPAELLAHGGLLFQDPEEQILTTRCDSEVAFSLESLGIPPADMVLRVREALTWAGMEGFAHRDPSRLSGGEQKRILLASVRARNPELWILDETLEELDEAVKEKILHTLTEEGRTVLLFASKEVSLFDKFPHRSFLLKDGILEELNPADKSRRLLSEGLQYEGSPLEVPGGESASKKTFPSGDRPGFLEAEGLLFRYAGGTFLLDIPRLNIGRGEAVALLGTNGSGKSTLARILTGLLKPQKGKIFLEEEGTGRKILDMDDLKRQSSYLFQNPDYQLFLPTVEEELLYGLSSSGRKARAQEAKERFHLPGLEAPPALLSYGARKRLQGALAYMQPRPLLILDEGDSGLSFADFFNLFHQLRSSGDTVLLITHHRPLAEALCHRILIMERGRIIREERP
jgi:energy-coupling factor transport system ATP-binding protein